MNRTRKQVIPAGQPFDHRHPLETGEADALEDPTWYARKMRENLDNLAKHLR